MNIRDKVSASRRSEALVTRESEINPPDFNPGMGDNMGDDFFGGSGLDSGSDPFSSGSSSFDTGTSDPFGSSSGGFGGDPFGGSNSFGSSATGSDPFGASSTGADHFGASSAGSDPFGAGATGSDPFGFGATGGFGAAGGFGTPATQQQQPPQKSMEDALFDSVAQGAKSTWNIFKAAGEAYKTYDASKRCNMGKQLLLTGGIAIVVGVLLWIFKFGLGFSLFFGGMLSAATGVVVFMVSYDKLQQTGGQPQLVEQPSLDTSFDQPANDFDSNFDSGFDTGSDFDSGFDSGFDSDFDSDFDSGDSDFGDDGMSFSDTTISDFDDGFDTPAVEEPVLSKEEILETLANLNGAVTRQYLLEHTLPILESITPNYADSKVLDTQSEDFAAFAAIVEDCATILKKQGSNDKQKLPQLIEVKEYLLYYVLTLERATWCKTPSLVTEIVNYMAYDESTHKVDETVHGEGVDVGSTTHITITKGETARVTLKDVILAKKDFFLDANNYMPCCLGVDSSANAVLLDLKNVNAMLVTGLPRSGKSWALKCILAQMMLFTSPRELQFYFFDPKHKISDFYTIRTPHVCGFQHEDNAIVNELRYIIHDLAPRRKEKIGAVTGCKNIWDYREACPTEDMPLIYVVIDEVMTLSDRMDKETKAEFQGLLSELVTQLPAVGIRLFLVPHVVKDTIIKKTTSSLIPCRISVGGDAEHIADTLGDTKFPYKLVHPGDMAVKLDKGAASFVHSSILASTNMKTDDFFDFLNSMWLKIDPSLEGRVDLLDATPLQVSGSDFEVSTTPLYQQPTMPQSGSGKSTRRRGSKKAETPAAIEFNSPDLSALGSKDEDDELNIWGDMG